MRITGFDHHRALFTIEKQRNTTTDPFILIIESMKRQFSGPITLFCLLMLLFGTENAAFSQSDPQKTGTRKAATKIKVPPRKRVLIDTTDGVELQADWFGGDGGKEALPVILIHDFDGDRSALRPLAEYLQTRHGHAVIVPDLRGHGESLNVKGLDEELDRSRFKKNQIASIVKDIDACRKFLQAKNDEGELNLDMLVVVACGKTNLHAAQWCIEDWSWPPVGGVKQGQNVKTLIMVSPVKRFKSMQFNPIIRNPLFSGKGASLPTLVMWGAEEVGAEQSKSIYDTMRKGRSEPRYEDPDERWEKKRLFRATYDSTASSEELLREQGTELYKTIALVIDKKVVAQKSQLTWQSRSPK